jgi:hypothetical protein
MEREKCSEEMKVNYDLMPPPSAKQLLDEWETTKSPVAGIMLSMYASVSRLLYRSKLVYGGQTEYPTFFAALCGMSGINKSEHVSLTLDGKFTSHGPRRGVLERKTEVGEVQYSKPFLALQQYETRN